MAPSNKSEIQTYLDNAWLRLGDTRKIKRGNPLKKCLKDRDNPGYTELKLMRDANYLSFAAKTLFGIKILPEQAAILEELWNRPFPMYIASRGFGKSFLIALYSMLKMVLTPPNSNGGAGVKIVIVGAAFRQSKVIFEYMESIWNNAPIMRSICGADSGPKKDVDRCTMKVNQNWAVAIPLGDGSKIRGLRATIIIADEFASIPSDIYETVVQGFASVSADPIENVDQNCRREAKKELGIWTESEETEYQEKTGNQIIISGTADYEFKPFAQYWKRYKDFITSRGDHAKLRHWFPDGKVPESFNYRDYSIIRIPYELIPKGFMDDKVVMRAKATVHTGIYQMEYGACFTSDSNGFYRRSLIESCVTSDKKPVVLPSGEIWFDAQTRGSHLKKYVYGVDPASEADNFSIVVIELCHDHSRIVYCWTTNRDDFKKRARAKVTNEDDFYGFCARKIRDLMRTFPCERIGMDAQGGGIAVMEALHDKAKLMPGEVQIWPIIDPDKEADTDGNPGLHILELIQFANAEWTSQANHGLRKDMEDKVLLFPRFDPLTLELAVHEDKQRSDSYKEKHNKELTIYDSLEDCVMEIEELKNELTTIVITRTGTGVNSRDRWDTPEVKLDNGRKGRMRKDRYSALVICNMVARQQHRAIPQAEYDAIGGFASDLNSPENGNLYNGPAWFTEMANDSYRGVKRVRR